MKEKLPRGLAIGIVVFIIGAAFLGRYFEMRKTNTLPDVIPPKTEITTFAECASAGYPILESYPEQCVTADGTHFINVDQLNTQE
jgi:hypothetical protein